MGTKISIECTAKILMWAKSIKISCYGAFPEKKTYKSVWKILLFDLVGLHVAFINMQSVPNNVL